MTVDLTEARRLEAAATPLPWRPCTHLRPDNTCDCRYYGEVSSESADVMVAQMGPCQFPHRHVEGCGADMIPVAPESERVANGQLIVHLRNHATDYFAAVEQRDQLREAVTLFLDAHYPNNGEGRTDRLTWTVPEHAFGALRAVLAASEQAASPGEHNHDEKGLPTWPTYRDMCPLGCDCNPPWFHSPTVEVTAPSPAPAAAPLPTKCPLCGGPHLAAVSHSYEELRDYEQRIEERKRAAARVEACRAHDRNGPTDEASGFPTCSECGAILTAAPAAEPSNPLNDVRVEADPVYWAGYRDGKARAASPSPAVAPLDERLRTAYTLLCSAEPALIRGVQQAPNATSHHYQSLLLDQVREWIAAYRDESAAYAEASEQAASPGEGERTGA